MRTLNLYPVDEIITQTETKNNYFGLIADTETSQPELHGYEVTMSGKLVLPELKRQMDEERKTL